MTYKHGLVWQLGHKHSVLIKSDAYNNINKLHIFKSTYVFFFLDDKEIMSA